MATPPTVSFPRDIPPFWFLLALVAEILLHALRPGFALLVWPWTLAGALPIGAGILLAGWGAALFKSRGTGVRPGSEATLLVDSGPYRFTRNPMYLGMVAILVGAALALGTATPWIVPPVFLLLIDLRFIRREERFLTERFGDAYAAFCRRVRRWL